MDIPKKLLILIIATIPVLEQKAAIPIGVTNGINNIEVFLYTYIGAIIPAPFIIYFIRMIFSYMKRWKIFRPIVEHIEKRGIKKGANIDKYKYLGLFLFVAIPLPGTGVWTGSLASVLFRLDRFKSLVCVALGAFVCGIIIMSMTLGFSFLF